MSTARLKDLKNIASRLNFKRLSNITKVYLSFVLSRWTGKNLHRGMPFVASIEPTTSCNLRCPECPSGLRSFTRPTGMLERALFEKTIDQLGEHLLYLIFYFQGEPYLNPHFNEMVAYAKAKKIYTATSTNAHYLDDANARKTVESGLDRLIISLDGTDQETYSEYRIGGNLSKVLEGTSNVVRWKKQLKSKTPHIIFQFLVTGKNEHQIPELKKLTDEYEVDELKLKTAQIYDYENGSELIPKNSRYSRYQEFEPGKWRIKNPLKNQCWKMWHSAVITWDGQVLPCCFDKDAEHSMGSLDQVPFNSIWKGAPYQQFRKSILRSRSEIEICKNCTEGTKVWG